MNSSKKRLGRGLGNLLSQSLPDEKVGDSLLKEIPLSSIQPGEQQAREWFDEESLNYLADSLREQGVLQPVIVSEVSDGQYTLIAGERRWRAAKIAGLEKIPALIRNLSSIEAMRVGLIENLQREGLNPVEQAKAFVKLHSMGVGQSEIARSTGCSRASVGRMLRLMDLHEGVLSLLEQGQIEMSHALLLLVLPKELQPDVAAYIIEKQLSVLRATKYIEAMQTEETSESKQEPAEDDSFVVSLRERLAEKFGNVSVKQKADGTGHIVIRYKDLKDVVELL